MKEQFPFEPTLLKYLCRALASLAFMFTSPLPHININGSFAFNCSRNKIRL